MATVTRVPSASRLVRWCVLLFVACDWNMGPSSCATSVTVEPPTATVQVGRTMPLYATVRDTAGRVIYGSVTWASDNTTVATVDQRGLVTGVAVGQTVVSATSDGQSGRSAITVTAAPVANPPLRAANSP